MANNIESQVASSASNFFQKYKFNDDQQIQIRKRVRTLVDGINKGDFTYDQIINGFNNTLGITNSNGFDDWGYAAAIVADAYKDMSQEETPKEKFNLSNIGSEFTKNIFGTDTVSDYSYFQRNPQEQVKLIKGSLQNIYNNFDNIFSTYEIADSQPYKRNLESAIQALNDNQITENDYLALSRATGVTNFDDWFTPRESVNNQQSTDSSSVVDRATTPQQETSSTSQQGTSSVQQSYPNFENAPKRIISLKDNMNNDPNDIKGFNQILAATNSKVLLQILNKIVNGKDPTMYFKQYLGKKFKKMISPFGIIRGIITELGRTKTINVGNDGTYYIPNVFKGNNAIWYDPNLNGGSFILRNKRYVSKNLHGGILKFSGGGVSNVSYNDKYNWTDIIYNSEAYKKAIQGITKENYEAANNLQNRYYTDHINTGWDQNKLNENNLVKQYQVDFNNMYPSINTSSIEGAINNGIISRAGSTGDNTTGNYADGYAGAMTNLRHLGTKDDENKIGELNEILKTNGLIAFVNPDTNMINFKPLEESESTQEEPNKENNSSEESNKEDNSNISWLFGRQGKLPKEKKKLDFTWLRNIYPELIATGRLFGVINANNLAAKKVRESLVPVLKDTYNLYSPVRGAFGERNQYYDQANKYLDLASKLNVSDSSKLMSALFDAQMKNNEMQTQGDIIDDKERNRTAEAALRLEQDNITRRSAVANENRASIIGNNQNVAQLEANRIKMNQNAVDEYLKGIESDQRSKRASMKYDAQLINKQIVINKIRNWQSEKLKQAQDAYKAASVKYKNITDWPDYQRYLDYVKKVSDMAKDMQYTELAKLYNISYSPNYTNYDITW